MGYSKSRFTTWLKNIPGIKHTLVIVCLVSIERRLCQKTDLCPLYFYLLIATLTGVLMTRPFVYCGSLPGDFELVAKLTQNSHAQKKILKE